MTKRFSPAIICIITWLFVWGVVCGTTQVWAQTSAIPQSEREALIALYNSTNGDSWAHNTNWRHPDDAGQFNDPGSEHTWYGVTCSPDLTHVEKIELPINHLSGTMPAELNHLGRLTTLSLFGNQLGGPIPDISGLTQLANLDLSNNGLTGSIPTWFNDLVHLRILRLGGNQLSGPIPDLSGLSQLSELSLSHNALSGAIPTWLNSLGSLQKLYLGNNQLDGTITDLSGLAQLTHLDLEGNRLNGPIPDWLNTLTNLRTLDLGRNKLNGPIPDLSRAVHLTVLHVHANQLDGPIPDWISNLTQLNSLYLSANKFKGEIPFIGSLVNLRELYLDRNKLTGPIPAEIANLVNLEYLSLAKNHLDGSLPTDLGHLTALKSLDLQKNRFHSGIPPTLGNLTALEALYLQGNRLDGPIPPGLSNLSNLVENGLQLEWNSLYTEDNSLESFINTRHAADWQATQTVAPTDLSVGEVDNTSVSLAWTPIPYRQGAGGYRVYHTTTSGSGYELAGTTDNKGVGQYKVANLKPETTYYFALRTFTEPHSDNANTVSSDYSPEVSAMTESGETLTLTAPNGGEIWEGSSLQAITWTSGGTISDVKIEYSSDSGTTWSTIVASTPNSGSYDWTVANTPAHTCLVKISDTAGTVSDESDGVFTIQAQRTITVTSPDGGESLMQTYEHNITWTSTGQMDLVNIYYSVNGGSAWESIAPSVPNNGTYVWWVPPTPSSQCLVKVTDDTGTIEDVSNSTFTIQSPTITVTAPNGGESLKQRCEHLITWTFTGRVEYVDIYYSINGGDTWQQITPMAPNTGSHTWWVPPSPSSQCLIKVADYEGYAEDVSNAPFTITPPTITVTAPDGGESLMQRCEHLITWTFTGRVEYVDIYYSINGGSTWQQITPMAPNTGSHTWWVPPSPSSQCLIKVADYEGYAEDVSNAPFTIQAPSITVTSPNGGESFMQTYEQLITWTSTGRVENVVIYYSTDGGAGWQQITPMAANTGSYTWWVPAAPSNQCLVKVVDYEGYAEDTSDAPFTIQAPSITVTSPNGGESFMQAYEQPITWTSSGRVENVMIYYSTNGGASWQQITPMAANTGSYTWWIPTTPSDQCLVKVVDYEGYTEDTSDAPFTIQAPTITVTAPNGGETVEGGSSQEITWTSTGRVEYVDIYYSTDAGAAWQQITPQAPNTGSYIWWVPLATSADCLVKVSDMDGYAEDTSDAPFTIQSPTITVTAPDGGETWMQEYEYNITWTSTGSVSTVNIFYSSDGGAVWQSIASGAANTGTYTWRVPTTPSSQCLVKVADELGNAQDTGNAPFTIAAPFITVTAPDGGEELPGGTSQNITWTSGGLVNFVDIYYSTDGGAAWQLVAASAANTGTYAWTVPGTPSADCLVKVADDQGYAEDISNASFSITTTGQGFVTLTSPNGGETWLQNSLHDITWIDDGTIANVVIDYSTDGGANWTTVAGPITNTGTYAWTVPLTPSADCLVRVADESGSPVDTSDASFTINAGTANIPAAQRDALIALYNSTNGDSWTTNTNWRKPGDPSQFNDPGSEHTWFGVSLDTDLTHVEKIELPGNGLSGTIPPDLGDLGQLQVLQLGDNHLSGTIPPALGNLIHVTALDLSRNQLVGSLPGSLQNLIDLSADGLNISWNGLYTSDIALNNFLHSRHGSTNWEDTQTIAPIGLSVVEVEATSVSLYWNPIQYQADSGGYRVYYSTTPGSGYTLAWTTADKYVDHHVVTDLDLDTTYYFVVQTFTDPHADNQNQVESPYSLEVSATTADAVKSITIAAPNGGETWAQNYMREITWTSTGQIDFVNIYYSTDAGAAWQEIVSQVPNSGSYTWWVPPEPSSQCLVKVVDDLSSVEDISDAPFTIEAPTITVTSPNGGEIWDQNYMRDITWTFTGRVDFVNIYYSTDAGGSWQSIVNQVPNSGSYTWWVPPSPSSQCLIKVVDDMSAVEDISDAPFTIEAPTITVTSPNGGEIWDQNYMRDITWTFTGRVDFVNIYYSSDAGGSWQEIVSQVPNTGSYTWWVPPSPSSQCLIKVVDDMSAVEDISDAPFTIEAPTITVTSPNGGEIWDQNYMRDITWTFTGRVDIVNIYYSTDAGGSWQSIANQVPNTGSYTWWVPPSPSNQCLVKVVDDLSAVEDISDAPFTIEAPTITVTSPNGGEMWPQNYMRDITWVFTGRVDFVNIYYSTDAGATWQQITSQASNTGSYSWWVPPAPSSQCLVKVVDDLSAVEDISDAPFTIEAPTITVTSPNGGETWPQDYLRDITWTFTGRVDFVNIYYSSDAGATWQSIASQAANSGSYTWLVPLDPSSQCLVKVVDDMSAVEDTSDATFTIEPPTITVTSPNGGDSWEGNTVQPITWTSTGNIANVKIEYSDSNGFYWYTIVASTPNTGSYNWTVANILSTDCLVRVSDAVGSASDQSDAVFTINPERTVTVTSPDGGETWEGGTGHFITWVTSGLIDNVKIEYTIDAGGSWNTLADSIGNSGSFYWPVPNTPSGDCLVRISDVAGPAVDTSNSTFTIVEQRTITVTSPNGGDSWEGNTVQPITWTSTGDIPEVAIEYSADNGANWNTIVVSTPNSGAYDWTVANISSGNCLVRVSDTSGSPADVSDAVFSIQVQRTITVTSPNGGETWEGGYSQAITWNHTGSIPNVLIEYSTDGGGNWSTVAASTPNTGTYDWTVANTPSATCLVRVSDTAGPAADTSNSTFTIVEQRTVTVTYPNGGEDLEAFTTHTITWTTTGNIANVRIRYSTFGTSYNTVVESTPNDGSFEWTVPNTPSTTCWLRINDVDGPATDINDATYTISAPKSITVVNPGNGDYLDIGSVYTIYWGRSGSIYNVKIEYTANNGGSWNTIAASTPNDGTYDWTVPDTPSTLCKVRVSDVDGPTSDTGDGWFTIGETRSITVTSPNGGEVWEAGTIQPITWDYTGTMVGVKLEYSTSGGAWWYVIHDGAVNNGSYNWQVPDNVSGNCLVRVSGTVGSSSISDVSDAPFSIVEQRTVTVTVPNGGESWEALTLQNITWTSTGDIPNVMIEYTTDLGSTWNTVVGSTPNTGSYGWTVVNEPSGQCRVRISDTAGPAVDTSNQSFTILPPRTLTLTAPNGGENWEGNTNHNITWTSTGDIPNVMIEYSTDSGAVWNTVTASTVNTGTYNWTVPNSPSSDCLVRISDTSGPAVDTGDAVFTIAEYRTVTVTAPNGGENWEGNTNHNITWTHTGDVPNVMIEYSTDSGGSWNTVIASTVNTGTYNWTVPNSPSTGCLVRISDTSGPAVDTGDAVFTIAEYRTVTVTAPNGGENWEGNTNHNITWTSTGDVPNVMIEYSTDSGAIWNTVTASTVNTGTYNWTVPNSPSSGCLVRVSDTAGPAVDTGDAVFTIAEYRTVTVTAPNGGENWEGNTNHNITWTHTGDIPNVMIEYSTDSGGSWNTVIASTVNTGTYNWTVPNSPSSSCLVRISDTAGPAVDTGDAVFTIAEYRTVTVTAPNGGENWEGNTNHNITWTSTGDVPNVMIEYSTDSGGSWNTVIASTVNTGTYNWTVPNSPSTGCLVRISDTAGPAVDTGDAVFTIAEYRTVTVTAPNGGENWEGNTNHNITWTSTGDVPNVMIEYSTDSGAVWNTVIASTVNTGTYNWTVPNSPSTGCLVRISDTAGPAVDTGDAVFTIAEYRTVTVTAPNGGENWEGNTNHNITWTSTGDVPNVMIEYSTDSGAVWNTVIASTVNTGTYNWTVPNSPSSDCLVRISDTSGPAVDTGDAVFTIAEYRTVTVTAPNGGENWEGNTNHNITWTSTGDVPNVMIEYSTDSGAIWNTVIASTVNTGTYNWTVPNSPSTGCLVRISDTAGPAVDTGDAVFTISEYRTVTVTAPNGGETWEGNTNHNITWTSTGDVPNVMIEYSTDSGAIWNTVTASTVNTGTYNWTVPNSPSSGCLVRVSDTAGPAVDTGDAVFTIAEYRTVTVTAPNGGEKWEGNTNHNITWTHTGDVPNVMIEYSTDSGGSWNTVIASTVNTGTYNWTVPNSPSTGCLVRISDTAGPAVDTGDAVFTIAEYRTVTVTAPNGGENWEGNTNHNITWTSTGDIPNVMIEYSTDSGAVWNTVIASTVNTGTYNWTVPNSPSSDCLVRISDTAGPAVDTSDAVFTIAEYRTVTVTAPNSGERWFIDSTYAITWTHTGDIPNVMIEYSDNNGGTWNTVTASAGNSGSYDWTIPNTPSSNCLVRIGDTAGPASDTGDAVFTIDPYPTITVGVPNGNETWDAETTQTITWSHTGTVTSVNIDYSSNGGASWLPIAAGAANTGSYDWLLPALDSDNCLVRVSDTETAASDTSNGTFAIWQEPSITVTAPNGGENWPMYSTQNITWTSTGPIAYVKIEHTENGGKKWETITSLTANSGSYQWTLPWVNKNKDECLVRITAADDSATDTSDAYFTILNQ